LIAQYADKTSRLVDVSVSFLLAAGILVILARLLVVEARGREQGR